MHANIYCLALFWKMNLLPKIFVYIIHKEIVSLRITCSVRMKDNILFFPIQKPKPKFWAKLKRIFLFSTLLLMLFRYKIIAFCWWHELLARHFYLDRIVITFKFRFKPWCYRVFSKEKNHTAQSLSRDRKLLHLVYKNHFDGGGFPFISILT